MSFLSKISSKIANKLPSFRHPVKNSQMEKFFNDYAWTMQRRNKSIGVGWNTYYKAMHNVWVNASIQTYIDEIINLGFLINNPESEEVNTSHVTYLTSLFNNPMGLDSNDTYAMYQSLMWRSYLGLGDAFSEIIHDPTYTNIPIGLKHIPTELMMWHEDTSQWGFRGNDYRFENDELIHIKDADIRGGVWGESKIDTIANDILLEILGRRYTLDILKNKGLDPRGVLEYDKDISDEAWNREIARLTAAAKEHSKGTLLVKGAKYTRASTTNQDMEFNQLMHDVRDRIIATFGVPPSKVSIIETANLGSGSGNSQDKNFKKTLKGKARNFEDAYSKALGRSTFSEVFQYKDLDIEDKLIRAQKEDIRLNNGSLTINEVRSSYGEPPVPWGNQPLTNHNSLISESLMDIEHNKKELVLNDY
ncbi:MAG: phage portal protein [Methanobacteriaceae archaeon]|nr:phage portal protein [Methanobacteriaceae archaeon]